MTNEVREALRDALLDPRVYDAAQKVMFKLWAGPPRTANTYDVTPILRAIWEAADLESGPFVEDTEIDEMAGLCSEAPPGPWRAVQLDGFGAAWFLVTDAPKQWHRVIAEIRFGNIYSNEFFARVREFVPTIIAELRRVKALLASRPT